MRIIVDDLGGPEVKALLAAHLGRGVGGALVRHIIANAFVRGPHRLLQGFMLNPINFHHPAFGHH